MGLKDLVAQKAALTEEAIEAMIADYVRYDTDEMEIAFTPEFASLGNKAKILLYLVGLQGWPFVVEEAISTAVKPAEIEEMLGISGGTLRPILKDLKDRHLIAVKIRSLLRSSQPLGFSEGGSNGSFKQHIVNKEKAKKKGEKKEAQSKGKDSGAKRKNTGLGETINNWIAEGFFNDGKTTSDVKDRFHDETIMVPVSSIPSYVNKAVRDDKTLTRKKEDVNGKQVWVYRTKK